MLEIDTIIQGDCLDVMKDIEDKSIDMILCDLPYGMIACKWDVRIPFESLWEAYKRIIKDNGAIVLNAMQPFASEIICSNLKWFKYEWIWDKIVCRGHLNAKKQPMRSHEQILVFYKTQCTYNPIFRDTVKTNFGNHNRSNTTVYGKFNESQSSGIGYPKSIISIRTPINIDSKDSYDFTHPTQKPVALFEYLIRTYTNEGDLVLDNCIGSGTTAVACVNLKRHFIGIELDKNYCDIANKRIANAIMIRDSQPELEFSLAGG